MAREVNVNAMLRRMTAKQFREWEHYDHLEPFGDVRADYRTALIAQLLFNINRGPDQKALPIEEFLLKFEPPEPKLKKPAKPQTTREIEALIANWVEGSNIVTEQDKRR